MVTGGRVSTVISGRLPLLRRLGMVSLKVSRLESKREVGLGQKGRRRTKGTEKE